MKYLLLILLIIFSLPTYARDRLVATVGLAAGGSTVVREDNFSFFFGDSRDELDAGDGLQSEFGLHMEFTDKMSLRLLGGYKYNFESFIDADHRIETFPTSATFFYKIRRVSFGGGLVVHIKPTYIARGNYSSSFDDTARFDNAIGFNAVLRIRLTRSELFSLGIRYTDITYKGAPPPKSNNASSEVRSGTSYNASNIALMAIFNF